VRLLDPGSGADLRPAAKARSMAVDAVAIDGAGRLVAADDEGKLWVSPATGQPARPKLVVRHSEEAALSADGSLSAFYSSGVTGQDHSVLLRDVSNGGKRKTRLQTDWVNDLTFAPEGDLLAVAESDSVSVYDTAAGEQRIGPLTVTTDPDQGVAEVAIANGARTLAAADSTGGVMTWDGVTGSLLGIRLNVARQAINALALSADGRRLAIAARPGVVLISLDEDEWRRRACEVANRGLTAAERRGLDAVTSERDTDPCRHANKSETVREPNP